MKRAVLALAAIALGAGLARAIDPPHDDWSGITCASCHTPHQAPGMAITTVPGNPNLCQSCHTQMGPAFGFPWLSGDQALPGLAGHSHRWDAGAVNASRGAQPPTNVAMSRRIFEGKIQCSTCHDQHSAANRGRQHTSEVVLVQGGVSGTVAVAPPAPAASPRSYLLEIVVAGGVGVATFRVSHDYGRSWFGWNGSAWQAGVATGRPTGAGVALTDGANVTVTFTGSFLAGDRWQFYLTYPFLRVPNDAAQMCEDCHAPRVQSSAEVESGGDGVKVFSHPVGEGLARSYDRVGALLDANGALQGGAGADTNATNDLVLDATSKVRCTTCHNPHNADSNALTEDPR